MVPDGLLGERGVVRVQGHHMDEVLIVAVGVELRLHGSHNGLFNGHGEVPACQAAKPGVNAGRNPPGIEGSSLQEGDRAILLEDVTTTGGSALKAARRIIEMGCELVACITILDREEGGAEAFEEAGIILLPLTVKSDIVG